MGEVTQEKLLALFGAEQGDKHLRRLENKNRGGINNEKGHSFELYYTVYQIARYLNQGSEYDNILFSSQIRAFIDDLLIEQPDSSYIACYQLKDVVNLSWTTDEGSLKDDFSLQYLCTARAGITLELILVVSKKELCEKLIAELPGEIKGKVNIEYFTTAYSLNNLIRLNPIFKATISQLCALKNPSVDKLETLAAVIFGAWAVGIKQKVPLSEIRSTCQNIKPNFIKGSSNPISQYLINVFKVMPGFQYIINSGYIEWTYNKTDSGVIPYPIGSTEYEQWENDLQHININSFNDIEQFLSF